MISNLGYFDKRGKFCLIKSASMIEVDVFTMRYKDSKQLKEELNIPLDCSLKCYCTLNDGTKLFNYLEYPLETTILFKDSFTDINEILEVCNYGVRSKRKMMENLDDRFARTRNLPYPDNIYLMLDKANESSVSFLKYYFAIKQSACNLLKDYKKNKRELFKQEKEFYEDLAKEQVMDITLNENLHDSISNPERVFLEDTLEHGVDDDFWNTVDLDNVNIEIRKK